MRIKKAIFPVAGLGSRFLPVTKTSPKEMLPLVDKPVIQFAVEEAARAGIDHIIFITSSGKHAIENYFDNNFELEARLHDMKKDSLLHLVKNSSPPGMHFTYVRQSQPLGIGHAILCAEHVIGNEPFSVLLADELIDDTRHPCLSALIEYFEHVGESILAVQSVPWDDVHQYGIVDVEDISLEYSPIRAMMEKPIQLEAVSNMAAVGRYVFTPAIFESLRKTKVDERGEMQLTDGIKKLLQKERVHAYQFHGKRYDCGSKSGYLHAVVEFGMQHAELGSEFREYLKSLDL